MNSKLTYLEVTAILKKFKSLRKENLQSVWSTYFSTSDPNIELRIYRGETTATGNFTDDDPCQIVYINLSAARKLSNWDQLPDDFKSEAAFHLDWIFP